MAQNKPVKMESLLRILRLLNAGSILKPPQLAEILEVTERTVYRYITSLQCAGYPIFFDRQKNSYCFIDGYSLTTHNSSNDELYQALCLKGRMTDSLAVGLISFDQMGQCVVANEAAALILGGSRGILLKQNYHNLELWKTNGLALTAQRVMESGVESHGEYLLTTNFGDEVWGYCSVSRFTQKGKPFLMLVFQDISLLKQTRIRLQHTEELLQKFLEYTPVYTFIKDEQSRPILLSRNYEQLFKQPLEAIIGKRMDELLPDDLARKVVLEDQKILASNELFQEDDVIDGRNYSTIKFAIHHESGVSIGGFMIDVTERKLIEQRSTEYAEQFHALLHTALDPLWIFNEDGAILDVNERACALYGYYREELLKMNCADVEGAASVEDVSERINEIIKIGSHNYTTCHRDKSGNLLHLEVTAAYMPESRKILEFIRKFPE